MAHYRSNLLSLHKLRTAARDTQQQRVADALRAEAALNEQVATIQAEAAAIKRVHRMARVGEFSVSRVLEIERYELVLKARTTDLTKQQEAVAFEVERRREELAIAEQQLRVVEKLDDRRRREFERREARQEQAILDEIATDQYLRKRSRQRHRYQQPQT